MPRIDSLERRIVKLVLPPPYDVLTIRAWVSWPKDLFPGVTPYRDIFAKVIVEHDMLGPDDKPLPTGEPELWDMLPEDLAGIIWAEIRANVGNFTPPASTSSTRST